jgi:hypothetical protein
MAKPCTAESQACATAARENIEALEAAAEATAAEHAAALAAAAEAAATAEAAAAEALRQEQEGRAQDVAALQEQLQQTKVLRPHNAPAACADLPCAMLQPAC